MASFELSGIRASDPGRNARIPLTLSSDAAKQPGFTQPNRKNPVPPGAAKPLESAESTPTKDFILDQIEERVGEPTPQRKIKEQLIDAGAGILRKREGELASLAQRLPSLDVEELNRQRIEKAAQERRRLEEASKKRKEGAETSTPDATLDPPDDEEEKKSVRSKSAEAARAYRDQTEKTSSLSTLGARTEAPEPAPKEPARKDVASGGASETQKGDPGVNKVA